MPEIRGYDSQVDKLTPESGGSEAFAQEGRRVGQFYHQEGEDYGGTVATLGQQYVQHQTDEELRNLAATTTQYHMARQEQLYNELNDPKNANNPNFIPQFMQETQEQLSELSSHAQTREGQRYAASRGAEIEQELFERGSSAYSTVATQAAVQQTQGAVNNLVSMTARSPADADANAGTIRDVIEASFPRAGVDPTIRARAVAEMQERSLTANAESFYNSGKEAVRQDYAKGVTSSPAEDALRSAYQNGKFSEYLPSDDFSKIPDQIDSAVRDGKDVYRVGLAAGKQQTEMQTEAQIGKIRLSLLPDENGNPPSPAVRKAAMAQLAQLVNSPDPVVASAAARQVESIGGVVRTQAEDTLSGKFTQDDPAALTEINQRKSLPPGTPGSLTKVELDDMRAAHRLSDKTYEEQTRRLDDLTNNPLLREQEARLTSWFHGTIRPKLTQSTDTDMAGMPPGQAQLFGSLSKTDPKGDAAAGIALNQTISQFEYMVQQQGYTPDAAYKAVTDPNSPNSVWQAMPAWELYAKNGPAYAAQHPVTYGHSPFAGSPVPAPPPVSTTPNVDARAAKVQATGPMKPGESWAAYKARAGIE